MGVDKAKVQQILDTLPENATWEDLIYQIYVIERIEKGLEDSVAGRTQSMEEVMAELGIA